MSEENGENGWNELLQQQRADEETAQMAGNQKFFDGYVTIENDAKRRQAALDRQKAIAGAAMIESAYRNGGMSDRSLSQAFSQAFGMPVFGGQIVDLPGKRGKGFVVYGAGQDAQGGQSVAPIAMMDGAQVMKVLNKAKLGDRTRDVANLFYGDLSSRFTPQQLESAGIQNPSAPISTGGAVVSGAGMRALKGQPRERSSISTFGADGAGGWTRQHSGPDTGFQTVREDGGTRAKGSEAKWKILSSGPDGKRYENDQTGEIITVPEGKTIADVTRGTSERERIAQMNNQSREAIQAEKSATAKETTQTNAEATRYKADMAKEVAEIRARQSKGRIDRAATANDAKRLSEIVGDLKLDDETRAAAKEALDGVLGSLSQRDGAETPARGEGKPIKPQYKAGDTIEKDGKKYELYTGDDGKLHARPVK